jgi:hypothetical protein
MAIQEITYCRRRSSLKRNGWSYTAAGIWVSTGDMRHYGLQGCSNGDGALEMEGHEEGSCIASARRFARNVSDYIDANLVLLCAVITVVCLYISISSAFREVASADWGIYGGAGLLSIVGLWMSASALSYRYRRLREAWSDVAYAASMKYSLSGIMFVVSALAVLLIHFNHSQR